MRANHSRGNVFVANLPPEFTDDELAETFDSFGIVLRASIARDPETGKRLRYGFVDIATERAAQLAVEAMNGTELDGHNLDVRISERPNKAKKRAPAKTATRRTRPGPAPRRDEPMPQTPEMADVFTAPPPRRQPTFQVERRSLPRRA